MDTMALKKQMGAAITKTTANCASNTVNGQPLQSIEKEAKASFSMLYSDTPASETVTL